MKSLLLFLFVGLSITTIHAQDQSTPLDLQFFQAYAMTSIPLWEDGIAKLTKSYASSDNPAEQLPLAKACYAGATNYMVRKNKEKCIDLLNQGEVIAEAILKDDNQSPEAHALKSGIMGLRIAMSPMKGMTLGGKSKAHVNKAVEYGPENPTAHLFKGNYLFYTPSMFGGDIPKAIEHLEKAKALFESNEQKMNWEYLATLAMLGQAYHKQEQLQDAKATYDVALSVAPNFGWVKMVLMPAVEKDLK